MPLGLDLTKPPESLTILECFEEAMCRSKIKLWQSEENEAAGDDKAGLGRYRGVGGSGPGATGLRREATDNIAVKPSGDVSKGQRRYAGVVVGSMGSDSGWPEPEFEWTGCDDKDSDTLAVGLGKQGKIQVRQGKGKPSSFSMGKQPQSDQRMLPGPPRPPSRTKGKGYCGSWTRKQDVSFLPYLRPTMHLSASPAVASRGDQVGGDLGVGVLCPGCLGIDPLSEGRWRGWAHRSFWRSSWKPQSEY